ncbi:MAG: hypothetical protein AAFX58_11170 [Pseudomonadota bacterium]
MSSGRRVLKSIDAALDDSRRSFRRIDTDVRTLATRLAESRRREAGLYRRLAAERLQQLDTGDWVAALDAADRRAGELLERRKRERAALDAAIEAAENSLTELTGSRDGAADALQEAEGRLAGLVESVAAGLADDAGHRAAVAAAQAAVDMAANAEQKAAEAEERRFEKGKPYEADRIFVYLWESGYCTSRYRAWPLTRLIDRVAARHIGFEKARRNYHLLNEIPRRLRQHTERLAEEAQAKLDALAALERAAEVAAGVEPLEADVERARQQVGAIDEQIAAAETALAELHERRERFVAGSDATMTEALNVLVKSFRAEPLAKLREEAVATPAGSDDTLIAELAELADDQTSLERFLNDQRDLHARHRVRLGQLSALRRRFKQKHFDSSNSVIDDRGNIELLLGEFLRGVVDSDRLWRAIRNAQRFRRSRRRSSGWGGAGSVGGVRIPRGMGGSGGFKAPRLPSGGGFRTKGGF